MGEKLIERGEEEFGLRLIANGYIHDNSKFFGIEWEYLHDDVLKSDKKNFLAAATQHINTNPHHPEFWGGVDDMPRIYIAEMVCDWYGRSIEFGSDLRQWIEEVAYEKYSIPPTGKVSKTIKDFLNLLLDKPFQNVKASN